MTRTYDEVIQLPTFEERFAYLKCSGQIGFETFGPYRYLVERFYLSDEWRRIRDFVIIRDDACDLATPGFQIYDKVLIHHINPITIDDVVNHTDRLINPQFLICTTHETHNALHYSNEELLQRNPIERKPGDTCLW